MPFESSPYTYIPLAVPAPNYLRNSIRNVPRSVVWLCSNLVLDMHRGAWNGGAHSWGNGRGVGNDSGSSIDG
jgi:hypothetical protein